VSADRASSFARGRGPSAQGPTFSPAWWLRNRHLQTLWGKLARRRPELPTRTVRWETPDGDFVDLLRMDPAPRAAGAAPAPRVLLLHGLEGSPRSHYVGGIFEECRRRGWGADLLVFRSCGAEPNRERRFYHSGETADAACVLERLVAENPIAPRGLVGISLGGNVLLKLLGERGRDLPSSVRAAAAVSVPFDLARGCRSIDRGFARVYQGFFLRSLRRKAREKLDRYPDLFDGSALDRVRSLWDYDDAVTAPVHGFESAEDYYARSSSLGFLERIRLPTLLVSAVDDPFLPGEVLDEVRVVARSNPALELEFVPSGGHVGFVAGDVPWRPVYWAERRVADFLATRLEEQPGAAAASRAG
jgi:predicted alpha/beta-fold hydrolase